MSKQGSTGPNSLRTPWVTRYVMSLIAPERVLVAGAFQWSRQTRLLPWNPLQVFDVHIQDLKKHLNGSSCYFWHSVIYLSSLDVTFFKKIKHLFILWLRIIVPYVLQASCVHVSLLVCGWVGRGMFFTVQQRFCCVRKYIDVKVEFPDFMKVITLPAQIQTQTAQTCTHTHTPGLVWWHSTTGREVVLWKHRPLCFAGSEQGRRIWALTLINLPVPSP